MRPLLLALVLTAVAGPAAARRRLVPAEYPTVQAAVDAAETGDTVLVAPGRYYENLQFRGRDVVVASHFAIDADYRHVLTTVLDGSRPAHPDSASVVRIVRGETRAAVLEGFTITGGAGTSWRDEHGAGLFVEGGGVLVTLASPTIRFNRIVGNRALRICDRCVSAGGGGIRVGDGAPLITHNVIADNEGYYGGGLIFNFAGPVVRNNVIVRNRVRATENVETFGGGGLFAYGVFPGPIVLEHNTIAGNVVEPMDGVFAGKGGGVSAGYDVAIQFQGNVVWGNTQGRGSRQLDRVEGIYTGGYNVVEGGAGFDGPGQLDADPRLGPDYTLEAGSPAVDAGDPGSSDPADPARPGMARAPARGTTRADAGAFGGPGAAALPPTTVRVEDRPRPVALGLDLRPNPAAGAARAVVTGPAGERVAVEVFDALGRRVAVLHDGPLGPAPVVVTVGTGPLTPGAYVVRARSARGAVTRTLVVR